MIATRGALLAILILASQLASAGTTAPPLSDYSVTTWNENDGLPAGRIRGIQQDVDGYLWLATDSGLVRFDGVRFEAWGTVGETRLPLGPVSALLAARDGSIWVGVRGQSPVGRISRGKLTLYGDPALFGGSGVLALLEDHAGVIWAGNRHGLFRFFDGRWEEIGKAAGITEGTVLAVHEDHLERLWVATASAVYRRASDHGPFERVDIIPISSNVWQSFSEDATGTVWISDFSEGFKAPGRQSRRPHLPGQRGWGVELLHDRRGNFWVGTQGQGLWRVRADERNTHTTIDVVTVDHGLASNAVQSLLEDREGNVWLGTLAGLQRLTPHKVTPVKNLPIPRAIALTRDGSVWVGTAAGLTRFSPAGRREYTEADGVPGSVVLALHADERGALWISTERGLSRFADERFSPILVRPDSRIQRVLGLTSSGGSLWLRDFYYRLFRWSNGELTSASDIPEALRSAMVFLADTRGSLWIGSKGALVVRLQTGQVRSYELGIGNLLCIFEDAEHAIWVGGDAGLTRFADGRFTTITLRNGFPGSVRSIVEDRQGSIWLGASPGILRLERAEIARVAANPEYQVRFRLFNTADGVAGVPFGEGSQSALRAQDGRMWFITSSGVTVVDPNSLGAPPPALSVRMESVTADASLVEPVSHLSLPPRTSHLQIAFSAVTLSDPTRVRFRYRLDGFDRDWVDAGLNRQASYTNLPPREYRFRVMASNSDGVWNETGAGWDFSINPMFYQTGWFYALCGFALFVILYASWRLRVRQVRSQFAMVLAERIRMSRAIHDTLLQGVAAMALEIDDLSHNLDAAPPSVRGRVLSMRRRLEEYIREARQSIWDLRSPRLETGLLQALREAGERAIAERPVQFDLSVKGTPQPPPASVQEQVLLICQEALNNAVHHGRASRVAVELDYADDRLRLRVTDDGCGFDPETVHADGGHYGLISMHERAEQVRGRVRIASSPGNGTQVETIVPVT